MIDTRKFSMLPAQHLYISVHCFCSFNVNNVFSLDWSLSLSRRAIMRVCKKSFSCITRFHWRFFLPIGPSSWRFHNVPCLENVLPDFYVMRIVRNTEVEYFYSSTHPLSHSLFETLWRLSQNQSVQDMTKIWDRNCNFFLTLIFRHSLWMYWVTWCQSWA